MCSMSRASRHPRLAPRKYTGSTCHQRREEKLLFDFSSFCSLLCSLLCALWHPSPLVKGLQRIYPYFMLQHSRKRERKRKQAKVLATVCPREEKAYRFVTHQSSNENLFTFCFIAIFFSILLALSLSLFHSLVFRVCLFAL